ncbi:hypothetical protein M2175_008756 [Bradyrhizobium elkanii]|uniref:hypothetical protein n=1 Tax=Bradyrhizobium TaxID=374 RepID=UPI00216737BF|nr:MULTISPECIES: hypothetical protein [Bradyrhizobium]MCS3933725.1 hypothetical protein [Bradyrhizobium elkanii]MCS3974282.1 hypothetical protein [Bradyrhizobium japonicum]
MVAALHIRAALPPRYLDWAPSSCRSERREWPQTQLRFDRRDFSVARLRPGNTLHPAFEAVCDRRPMCRTKIRNLLRCVGKLTALGTGQQIGLASQRVARELQESRQLRPVQGIDVLVVGIDFHLARQDHVECTIGGGPSALVEGLFGLPKEYRPERGIAAGNRRGQREARDVLIEIARKRARPGEARIGQVSGQQGDDEEQQD